MGFNSGFKGLIICGIYEHSVIRISDCTAQMVRWLEMNRENCIMGSSRIYIPRQILCGSSRTVGWAGNAACMRKYECTVGLLVKNLKDKPLSRRRSRWDDIKMGLKNTWLEGMDCIMYSCSIWSVKVAGCFEQCSCIECEQFLDHLRNYQLFKNDPALSD